MRFREGTTAKFTHLYTILNLDLYQHGLPCMPCSIQRRIVRSIFCILASVAFWKNMKNKKEEEWWENRCMTRPSGQKCNGHLRMRHVRSLDQVLYDNCSLSVDCKILVGIKVVFRESCSPAGLTECTKFFVRNILIREREGWYVRCNAMVYKTLQK